MPSHQRLCDTIYSVVIEADLTESERIDLFHTLSRYIIHLADGFEMRRMVLQFDLKEYYYGDEREGRCRKVHGLSQSQSGARQGGVQGGRS